MQKTHTFCVELTHPGDNRRLLAEVVGELRRLGAEAAQRLVSRTPIILREGLHRSEAERIKAALEATGAQVTLDWRPSVEMG
jgi:large subunit ribosomal protein L7/L12